MLHFSYKRVCAVCLLPLAAAAFLASCGEENKAVDAYSAVSYSAEEAAELLRADGVLPVQYERELRKAVNNDNVRMVRLLLAAGVDVNGELSWSSEIGIDVDGNTLLFEAVANADKSFAMVELLLSSGADVNARRSGAYLHNQRANVCGNPFADERCSARTSYQTPLHLAAEKNNLPLVRLLLAFGADANAEMYVDIPNIGYYASRGRTSSECRKPADVATDTEVKKCLYAAQEGNRG